MARFRDLLLKNRNFSLFWLSQVISNFGDRLTQMALIAYVYQRSPGSSLELAKLVSFTVIPVFLIGPVAGVWVDRWNRKHVLVISDILRAFLVLLIPFFIFLHRAPLIYAAVFLIYSTTRFFIPGRMAIIPDLVPEDTLLRANSLSHTTRMIGNAIGLVVAGLLVNIRSIGAIGGFYIDSCSFLLSAALIGMIVSSKIKGRIRDDWVITQSALKKSFRQSIISDIKEGVRSLGANHRTRILVGVFFLLMAGAGAVYCVIIVFVQNVFGSATRDLSLLGVSLMAGLFIGTVLYGRYGKTASKESVSMMSLIASGMAILLFTIVVERYPYTLVGLLLAFMMGLAAGPITVSVNTMIHEAIPGAVQGRAFSSLEVVGHLAFLACMLVASFLSKHVAQRWILIASGILLAICGVMGITLVRRSRRAT